MILALLGVRLLAAGAVKPPDPVFQIVLALASSGAVVTVLATVAIELYRERNRRRDAAEQRVLQSSKDLAEGETVREASYRDMAEQSRKNAESAVATIERALSATQALADRLQVTVDSQTETIRVLTATQVAQSDVIRQLTADRDASQAALATARQTAKDQELELDEMRRKLRSANDELKLLDDLLRGSARKRPVDPTGPIPTMNGGPSGT